MLNITNEARFPDTEWIAPVVIGQSEGRDVVLLADDAGEGPIVGIKYEGSDNVFAAPLPELMGRVQGDIMVEMPN
jgi:hypothetical protein